MKHIDTIVLAAGRGSRLRGVAAPYHKPFMVVNGRPLILGCVDAALTTTRGKVIVVAAPDNVVPMTALLRDADLLNPRVRIIVQPDPMGPGDAFLLGSELVTETKTMILLADNVLSNDDVRRLVEADDELMVGCATVATPEVAARFTRIRPDGMIIEQPTVDILRERWDGGSFRVWVGPLIVPTNPMRRVLLNVGFTGELKIGRHLSLLGVKPTLVPVSSYDVGMLNELEDVK